MLVNTEVLKEPRGFIKFLEIVIAICAFATTTSHHSYSQFEVGCPEGPKLIDLPFGYSYRLENTKFFVPVCKDNGTRSDISLYGNYSSAAEFYVFVGVMAFLYSLFALGLYVFRDDLYAQTEKIPIIDFVVTVVFAALWLISSSAWADALTKIKHYTDPNDVINDPSFKECNPAYGNMTCRATHYGNFASLNVSIIFGFLNLIIWAGNLWFLYKETKWFKPSGGLSPDHTSPDMPPQSM